MSSAHFESGPENKSPPDQGSGSGIDPREGARLIRAFIRIKNQAIREEIIHMVEETAAARVVPVK
jgi:hypothetical protein